MKKTLALALLLSPLAACKSEAPVAPPAAPVVVAPAPAAPVVAAPVAAAPAEVKLATLTTADVEKRRKEPNFFVFDNNTKDRYAQGHVPGAKWLDPSAVTAAVLPADKNATLVFYCANTSCGACHQGAKAAIELGYKNVFIMPDGIAGWETAKLATEKNS